ncbi:MAG: CDP-diacylglycerol--serine O-phosphatidyltransferase, partial [Acidobacteriota bacterium]
YTESDFGKELDSLADVLTFGAAPALLAYMWGLGRLGRLGWLVPVFFLLCVSIRLARFNVQTKAVDSRYFVGLPAPAAASSVAAVLYFFPHAQDSGSPLLIGMIATLVVLAGLMVSTFRFRSFKEFDLKRRWSYRTAALVAVLLLLISYDPATVFFSAVVLYSLSGPVEWAIRRRTLLRPRPANAHTREQR